MAIAVFFCALLAIFERHFRHFERSEKSPATSPHRSVAAGNAPSTSSKTASCDGKKAVG
jgi:hypothetical protein